MIPSFAPKIKVTLKKVPRREGAGRVAHLNAGVIPEFDLTPYLGESGGVVTNRGINQPAGTFSITLADKQDSRSLDSLYASIEPMDYVEIRMARVASNRELPIVMRGFVSRVERVETMGQDGRPVRAVQVTGHDFAKILQVAQISYEKEYLFSNWLLTLFPLSERYGTWYAGSVSDFVRNAVGLFVREFLGEMFLFGALEDEPAIKVDATVTGARVGPFGLTNFEGDIWQLLANWTDLGWNELFVEDREDAPYLVYRPVPWYDLEGRLIMADAGAVAPPEIQVGADEVESQNLARSDQNVANFFRLDAPMAEVINRDWVGVKALQDGLTLDYGYRNNQPEIYGLRKMTIRSNQGPDDGSNAAMVCTAEEKRAQADSSGLWYMTRTRQLKALHRDNAVYEEGSILMRGNETIKPGHYIRLKRGILNSRYYVTHVTQQFHPFNSFKTTLQLARGEGYIDRLNSHASPYNGEKGRGAYG